MTRRLVYILITTALVLLIPVNSVLALVYYTNVTVNNPGSHLQMAPLLFTWNAQGHINNGYLTATGLDACVYYQDTRLPTMIADTKLLFAAPVPSGVVTYKLRTKENPPAENFSIITGYNGFVTTPYNEALSIDGRDFSITITGYFDMEQNNYILNKPGVMYIETYYGNIHACLYTETDQIDVYLYEVTTGYHSIVYQRTGTVYTISIDGSIPSIENQSKYDASGELSTTPLTISPYSKGALTHVHPVYTTRHGAADATDIDYGGCAVGQRLGTTIHRTFGLYNTAEAYGLLLHSAKLTLFTSNFYTYPFSVLRVDGTVLGDTISYSDYGKLLPCTEGLGQAISISTPANQEINIPLEEIITSGRTKFAFRSLDDVTAYDVVNAGYLIPMDLVIYYYETGPSDDPVPDTADWIWMSSCMPYAGMISVSLDGSLKLRYQPDAIINGNVLPDTVSNFDGIITWGANLGDISVVFSGPFPDYKPSGPNASQPSWSLIPSVPSTPSGLFSEGGEGMPGIRELANLSEATGNPRALFPLLAAYLISLLSGFAVYGATHKPGQGIRGSLFMQSITSIVVMTFFVVGGGGIIPGWSLIPLGIIALLTLTIRNPQSSHI